MIGASESAFTYGESLAWPSLQMELAGFTVSKRDKQVEIGSTPRSDEFDLQEKRCFPSNPRKISGAAIPRSNDFQGSEHPNRATL